MQIRSKSILQKLVNLLSHPKYSTDVPYFITTPIYYVNGAPHIGHLQSCVYADALSRMHRLMGRTTIFSTGTDEHGQKINQAARASGKDPSVFCKEVSDQFRDVFREADISFTRFVRTTEERHKAAVQTFWEKVKENGFIYKGAYEGWYNVSEETFVPASQVKEVKDSCGCRMVCAESGQPLELMSEDNYIFKLSKFKDDLLYWYKKDVIKPKMYAEQLRKWVEDGLQDLSVSRQSSRLPWGVPVPGDASHTVYVWLDALVNYLTVAGYPEKMVWPPSCHVIGKDILKFHAIYWPAFLMAAGLDLPSSIFCHSHWTVDHEKMSKSKGNVVDPRMLIAKYGCDGLRYFLLHAATPQSDANYSETKIFRLLNAELADTLGNLLSRCCAPALNKAQVFPPFSQEALDSIYNEDVKQVIESASALPAIVPKHYLDGDFYHGIELVMDCVRKTNGFVQSQKPWKLASDTGSVSQARLGIVLHVALEVLRVSGVLLLPVIPRTASHLLDKLNVPDGERTWLNLRCFANVDGRYERTLALGTCVLYARRKA